MKKERIVLGGGCFWCIEAVYRNVKGVISVVSGYAGGVRANPSYENVCSGATGHAEIVDIVYDADVISLSEIVDIFFEIHDSTTLNAQGADKGTQYRSVIYYADEEQKRVIEEAIAKHQQNSSEKSIENFSESTTIEFTKAEENKSTENKKIVLNKNDSTTIEKESILLKDSVLVLNKENLLDEKQNSKKTMVYVFQLKLVLHFYLEILNLLTLKEKKKKKIL